MFDEDGIPITTKMRFDNDNDKDTTSGLRVPILLPVASWLMGVIRVCLQSSCPSPSVQPSRGSWLPAPGMDGWMELGSASDDGRWNAMASLLCADSAQRRREEETIPFGE